MHTHIHMTSSQTQQSNLRHQFYLFIFLKSRAITVNTERTFPFISFPPKSKSKFMLCLKKRKLSFSPKVFSPSLPQKQTIQNSKMINSPFVIFIFIVTIILHTSQSISALCRNFCNNIPINYPFSIDDGCGASQFRHMLNCSASALFFITPSGSYKVQTIDYTRKQVVVFDPSMSTCSILQPHHDFSMTDIQSTTIPPSPDTVFALMNCSIDSPVLNHYRSLCFNFSGHSCDELYASCTSFKIFHLLSNATSSPPCCFTRYDTVRFMSMEILDCTHYTTVYNVDRLEGVAPLDWMYGIKLTYGLPELGCDRCTKSGGTCGFDVETLGFICICSTATNATRDCGGSINQGKRNEAPLLGGVFVLFLRLILVL